MSVTKEGRTWSKDSQLAGLSASKRAHHRFESPPRTPASFEYWIRLRSVSPGLNLSYMSRKTGFICLLPEAPIAGPGAAQDLRRPRAAFGGRKSREPRRGR